MSKAMVRILFAGVFALVALGGAVAAELTGHGTPEWLIAIVSAAGGYAFGHAQENGLNGKGKHP